MDLKRRPSPVDYRKLNTDQLLELCHRRIPWFALNLFIMPPPAGGVMFQWRYDIGSPMGLWQRARASELSMGGTVRTIGEALALILGRVDRFDAFVYESAESIRLAAQRAADARSRAAAVPKPAEPEPDEGDEETSAEELPEVTPVPELDPYLVGILKGGKPS